MSGDGNSKTNPTTQAQAKPAKASTQTPEKKEASPAKSFFFFQRKPNANPWQKPAQAVKTLRQENPKRADLIAARNSAVLQHQIGSVLDGAQRGGCEFGVGDNGRPYFLVDLNLRPSFEKDHKDFPVYMAALNNLIEDLKKEAWFVQVGKNFLPSAETLDDTIAAMQQKIDMLKALKNKPGEQIDLSKVSTSAPERGRSTSTDRQPKRERSTSAQRKAIPNPVLGKPYTFMLKDKQVKTINYGKEVLRLADKDIPSLSKEEDDYVKGFLKLARKYQTAMQKLAKDNPEETAANLNKFVHLYEEYEHERQQFQRKYGDMKEVKRQDGAKTEMYAVRKEYQQVSMFRRIADEMVFSVTISLWDKWTDLFMARSGKPHSVKALKEAKELRAANKNKQTPESVSVLVSPPSGEPAAVLDSDVLPSSNRRCPECTTVLAEDVLNCHVCSKDLTNFDTERLEVEPPKPE